MFLLLTLSYTLKKRAQPPTHLLILLSKMSNHRKNHKTAKKMSGNQINAQKILIKVVQDGGKTLLLRALDEKLKILSKNLKKKKDVEEER